MSLRNLGRPEVDVIDLSFVIAISTSTVGVLLATRRPENPIGWVFLAMAVIGGIDGVGGQYALWGLTSPTPLPGLQWAAWLFSWPIQLVVPGGLLAVLILTFPTGRAMSPRWRALAWVGMGLSVILALSSILADEPILVEEGVPRVPNPTGVVDVGGLYLGILVGALLLAGVVLVAAAFGLVLRFRRSRGEERLQLKWFSFAIATTVGSMALLTVVVLLFFRQEMDAPWLGWLFNVLIVGGFAIGVPVACGIAILKYRLYGIDLVISKTLVFGTLAAFITAVYVAVVVGIGSLVGRGDEPNLALSIAATAVVAVVFQPVRSRIQHLANRLVYGKRATPYEVLSRFAGRMAGAAATEEILPRMARTLGEATGASSSVVWLRFGEELRPAAAWPEDAASSLGPVPFFDGELPALPRASLSLPVRHGGELLGALAVTKAPGDRLTPTEEKLASHLASQSGLVLRNARLTEELRARLDELQASRKRLVATQDTERRRLERNLHDGAQQQLVALSVKVRLAQQLAARDRAAAVRMVETLEEEARDAVETLRDLARGIYPAMLAERGLPAALEAQARKGIVSVTVDADGIGRYPRETEAAVYFCVLEALQNVAKYAEATNAAVRLKETDGELRFDVTDDGKGFDPSTTPKGSGTQNMADRLAALGGRLELHSAPGKGTTLTGRVPVQAREPVR